jgi:RecB family exonuclease
LRYVQQLAAVRDDVEELDGAAFGSVLHEVLQRFGIGPCRDSTDADEIAEFLSSELRVVTHTWFGKYPRPAAAVQIEQMRLRLAAFAKTQAAWSAQGWRIEHTEVPDGQQPDAALDVDGSPMRLTGRIDRIDVHRDAGQRIILDYKSSDAGQRPEQTHQKRGRWVDLQLPLYRHFARALKIDGPVKLGYIVLPKDTKQTAFHIAPWSDVDLRQADEVARDVVRGVRLERFWPPVEPPPDFSEEFAPICLDGVFDKPTSSVARTSAP